MTADVTQVCVCRELNSPELQFGEKKNQTPGVLTLLLGAEAPMWLGFINPHDKSWGYADEF